MAVIATGCDGYQLSIHGNAPSEDAVLLETGICCHEKFKNRRSWDCESNFAHDVLLLANYSVFLTRSTYASTSKAIHPRNRPRLIGSGKSGSNRLQVGSMRALIALRPRPVRRVTSRMSIMSSLTIRCPRAIVGSSALTPARQLQFDCSCLMTLLSRPHAGFFFRSSRTVQSHAWL